MSAGIGTCCGTTSDGWPAARSGVKGDAGSDRWMLLREITIAAALLTAGRDPVRAGRAVYVLSRLAVVGCRFPSQRVNLLRAESRKSDGGG